MMRVAVPVLFAVVALALAAGPVRADPAPGWNDVPALVSFATASVDKDVRACVKKLPRLIALIATRDPKTGSTVVAMPFPNVGQRGFTPEERCLMKAIAKTALPDLPHNVERVVLGHAVDAPGVTAAAPEPAFKPWADLPAALTALVDDNQKAALAACDKTARTVHIIFDLSHGKTRVWLPAWQFHSASGDGSTPTPQQKVKACINKVIASWKPAPLPHAMAELNLSVAVSP